MFFHDSTRFDKSLMLLFAWKLFFLTIKITSPLEQKRKDYFSIYIFTISYQRRRLWSVLGFPTTNLKSESVPQRLDNRTWHTACSMTRDHVKSWSRFFFWRPLFWHGIRLAKLSEVVHYATQCGHAEFITSDHCFELLRSTVVVYVFVYTFLKICAVSCQLSVSDI